MLGNLLGGLAGYYRQNRALRLAGILAMAFHPIPYYIVAFLLLIVFGYLWPVLPISGGYTMNMARDWSWAFIGSLLSHGILPVLSLALVGLGGWFMGMRSLVSNIVTEDYVAYAELAGVERSRILRSYVMRNALVPQVTGLAMSLGAIFNGAIITEQVFGYPGVGTLAGLGRPCRRLQPGAGHHHGLDPRRVGRGAADRPRLSAARSPREGALSMGVPARPAALQPPVRGGRRACWRWSRSFACLSFFSPYPPNDSFVVPPDVPPSAEYWFGTTSRGQDLFWLLTFAIRNTLAVRHRRRRAEPPARAADRPGRGLLPAAGSTGC